MPRYRSQPAMPPAYAPAPQRRRTAAPAPPEPAPQRPSILRRPMTAEPLGPNNPAPLPSRYR